ncbi:hypothetical protein BKA25_003342 [Actinoalloteichus hymeniacidonis]|nr:hypothetical protein [Actinoalloteichus hymeniacidonis]
MRENNGGGQEEGLPAAEAKVNHIIDQELICAWMSAV